MTMKSDVITYPAAIALVIISAIVIGACIVILDLCGVGGE